MPGPLPLHKRLRLAQALVLSTLLLLACGCFGGGAGAPADTQQKPAEEQDAAAANQGQTAPRNTLRASMPALTKMSTGSEFEFVLSGSFSDPLHQASARIVFDSRVAELVSASRGDLIPQNAVYLARTDMAPGSLDIPAGIAGLGYDAVVPFAFTRLPEDPASTSSEGELLRLRFRLRGPARAGQPAVRLLNDQEWLQLRDSAGRRLSFDFEAREEAR